MKSKEKIELIKKIRKYEKEGLFNNDVENDPQTKTLMPNEVDYLAEKLSTKFWTYIANRKAVQFYEKEIKNKNMVIKEVKGIENYLSVSGGAIITCNHFSVYDNYAIYRAIRDYLPKGHQLYKVIREGNYTNFKGLFGFLFRHCNTLPLSSNTDTMKNFLKAVSTLLKRGEKILIYPEQAMWWNYKKPRPLKDGAFNLASRNKVPVIPAFITLEDTDKLDRDGFFVQAYTVWFLPPIYPDKVLTNKENAEQMKDKNYKLWKELYEEVYKIELRYD